MLNINTADEGSVLRTASGTPYLQPGTFIISNHADELTPWTPVLASIFNSSGYISIPCCSWAFDTKFERSRLREYNAFLELQSQEKEEEATFVETLNLGGDAGSHSSAYSVYRIWLAKLSLACGWDLESETLRIPSTRNWAIVGKLLSPSIKVWN